MANPTLLSRLLCADADKNTIPDTDAGTAGVFSQQYGWQAINSLPLSAGGKAVQRQDFNGVFNLLGGIAFYAQKGYTWEWDITQDYYANCVVTDPLDGNKYNAKNNVAKGGSNPSLDSTNWELFGADTAVLANTDLSNLTATGLNAFATKTLSNLDTSNLACHLVVDSYYNGTTENWYRVYDDGWVEQGGIVTDVADNSTQTLSLLKPMADTGYAILLTRYYNASSSSGLNGSVTALSISTKTTTSFKYHGYASGNYWQVCGMGAQS